VERGSLTVPGAIETRLVDSLKESNAARTTVDGAIFIRNGMAVGGGSLVNVDLCFAPTLPSIQFKIDQWRKDGRIGAKDFSLEELAKAYDWVKAAIGTRVLSEAEINSNNRALLRRVEAAGAASQAVRLEYVSAGEIAVSGDGQAQLGERADFQGAGG